jgi:hypothetical protein
MSQVTSEIRLEKSSSHSTASKASSRGHREIRATIPRDLHAASEQSMNKLRLLERPGAGAVSGLQEARKGQMKRAG